MGIFKSPYRIRKEKEAADYKESEKRQAEQTLTHALGNALNAYQHDMVGKIRWERRRFYLDLATVGAVILGALFAGGQLLEMKGQLDEMRGATLQTERTIAASNRLADLAADANAGSQSIAADQRLRTDEAIGIAGSQLKTAQDTSTRQLRAYIWTVATPIENFGADKIPRWGVQYGAIGETPAYDVLLHVVLVPLPYPRTPDLKAFYYPKDPSQDFKSVVFPRDVGASASVDMKCLKEGHLQPCPLSAADFKIVNDAKDWRMFLVGVVTYKDAFGRPHRTPICYDYNPNKTFGNTNETCPRTPEAN